MRAAGRRASSRTASGSVPRSSGDTACPSTFAKDWAIARSGCARSQPNDPTDAVWRFCDLPGLAQEAKDHGLTEMVLWGWQPGFDASLPAPFPHLGTRAGVARGGRECRKIGVNVAPFISVLQASPKTAGRYGLKIPDNNGWTYHTELIPRWNPPYATGLSCVQVGPANAQWQDEVVEACQALGR